MKQEERKNLKKYWQLAFLSFLIIGTVLIIRHQRTMPYQHDTGMVFGTIYNVTYQCDRNLKKEIEAELKKVDDALSMFNENSVISHVNQGQGDIPKTEQGKMFSAVMKLAAQVSRDTDGAFDITVGPLVTLWGFGFKNDQEPTQQAIDSIMAFVGYKNLTFNEKRGTMHVGKKDPRMTLDCSAIAKGYGSDVVASFLKKHEVENFMVEIGGEVVTKGISPNRVPWHIGVSKPTEDSLAVKTEVQTILNVTDVAMATSGNYRNFYYKGGKKYAHTIDPKTGHPVQHNILSATVLAPDCATADAYATAFMVLGLDGARKILDSHTQLQAYFICSDEKGDYTVWFSPALQKLIVDN